MPNDQMIGGVTLLIEHILLRARRVKEAFLAECRLDDVDGYRRAFD